jgi:hypothetical protein
MHKAIPEQSPLYIGFASASAALEHQSQNGGWIFVPDDSAGATWFDGSAFTAGSVLRHFAARGSGKLY